MERARACAPVCVSQAGSAIDQLLYRQKAVSGMETRRPGESAEQFFKRKVAGMRMLNADAGTADAKQLEAEVDIAVMNANTTWHWGAGDQDADLADDDGDAGPLMLTNANGAGEALQLTYNPEADGASAAPGLGSGAAGAGAMVMFDPSADHTIEARKKRQIIGSEGIRASASLVPKAAKDCLSNAKLRPLDSGRGFALLEKMGWKAGMGLGRSNDGAMLPVEAMIKTDMGGLRVDEEEDFGSEFTARDLSADGEAALGDTFTVNAASILAAARGGQVAASMDSEFSSITSQTKSVQQINEENRLRAAGLLPPADGADGAAGAAPPVAYAPPQAAAVSGLPAPPSESPVALPPPPSTLPPPPAATPAAPPPPAAATPAMPPPPTHPPPQHRAMPPPPAYPPPPGYAPPGYPGYPPPAYPGYPPPAYPGYPPMAYPGYPPAPYAYPGYAPPPNPYAQYPGYPGYTPQ